MGPEGGGRVHKISHWIKNGQDDLTTISSFLLIGIFPACLKLILTVVELALLTLIITGLGVFNLLIHICCCIDCQPDQSNEGFNGAEGKMASVADNSITWIKSFMSLWIAGWAHLFFSMLAIASLSILPFVFDNLCDVQRTIAAASISPAPIAASAPPQNPIPSADLAPAAQSVVVVVVANTETMEAA